MVSHKAQMKRMTPDQLVRHLETFELDLRFSAGVWFFFPGGGRFHDAYCDRPQGDKKEWLKRVFDISYSLKPYGLSGLEAHYPNEVNEELLPMYKQFARDTGIRLVSVVPFLFFDRQFEWGSLSSPIPAARQAAIDRTIKTLQINQELKTDFAIVWPGIDGYENPFGIDFVAARDRFADGLAEAMDAVPGVPVAEEPKPYEPRGHILYGTTPEGVLLALKVEGKLKNRANRAILAKGESLVGLNPEVGHVLMGFEDLAYAYSLALEYGKLFHTHWNSQPLGNYDQDLNVGVISPEQTEAMLYVLKMYSYKGYFGIDINPERMPVERAIINCIDAIRAANDRINSLDHEAVIACTSQPDKNRGVLEALLIRARARNPKILSPTPRVRR